MGATRTRVGARGRNTAKLALLQPLSLPPLVRAPPSLLPCCSSFLCCSKTPPRPQRAHPPLCLYAPRSFVFKATATAAHVLAQTKHVSTASVNTAHLLWTTQALPSLKAKWSFFIIHKASSSISASVMCTGMWRVHGPLLDDVTLHPDAHAAAEEQSSTRRCSGARRLDPPEVRPTGAPCAVRARPRRSLLVERTSASSGRSCFGGQRGLISSGYCSSGSRAARSKGWFLCTCCGVPSWNETRGR